MDADRRGGPEKPPRFPKYDLRDYPAGVEHFVNTFPPERRREVRAAIAQQHTRFKAANEWMDRQVQQMTELPDIVYKYAPGRRLKDGFPRALRATQPSALNDVMEGNIRTAMSPKMDRDRWYAIVSAALGSIFGDDTLPDDELDRRKRLYGGPRVSTIVRDYLSRFVGVVSFSLDPLVSTMWAHYAENSGFVVGYSTLVLRELGVDLRRVIYMELAPSYMPSRDNVVRLDFVDEEGRERERATGQERAGTRILGSRDLLELRKDWRELSRLLFVKGDAWAGEKEARLLVDFRTTRTLNEADENGLEVCVLDLPSEAVEEVYVGISTPKEMIREMERIVGVGEGMWKLRYTDFHAYRMQVTLTSRRRRSPARASD